MKYSVVVGFNVADCFISCSYNSDRGKFNKNYVI